jgi:cytochrome c
MRKKQMTKTASKQWIVAIGSLLVSAASAAQSFEHGRKVFEECIACHALKPTHEDIGPSLLGVVGRKAGGSEGFRYSNAIKRSNVVWNKEALEKFLLDPQAFVPGNRMPYAGLEAAEDRAAVIQYLETLR